MASPLIDILLIVFTVIIISVFVDSYTDQSDVDALGILFTSLNADPQLVGWSASNGDPCGAVNSWKGVTCVGSSVTLIELSGLGLNGTLGYRLSDLSSLKKLDLSNNKIHDTIPYQLPPNLTYLNLAGNNLSGNVPYSVSMMVSLNYLNVSHNALLQSLPDVFANLQGLSDLDFSFNNLSGDLPNSFSSLSNLSALYLQNNQLTGSVNVLSNLGLSTLNIANNHFSGWIPQDFSSITDLQLGGNSFANGPAPPPPPYMPPPSRPRRNRTSKRTPSNVPQGSGGNKSSSHESGKKNLSRTSVIGIVIGAVFVVLLIALIAILCIRNFGKRKDDNKKNLRVSVKSDARITNKETEKEMAEQSIINASLTSLRPPAANQVTIEKSYGRDGSNKRPKSPITATSYTVATLQVATNSFGQDCLVGEGSLGRVYRAEFPNGKVLAVKKVDSAVISLQEEDNFLEAVSNMSRLRHPNIVSLVGYCVEYGQRLLVYEYIGNGTLHDMLHFADERSKMLSWNVRVRVALGTARALEYLHEVCLPSVVHRNFKSANILLDEELNPHLSDCGLAALTPNTERQVSTEVVGSFGYSAPEFAMSGVYTVKSDVYSFGVVMLELLTGRKPLDSSRTRLEQSLVRWASPQLHDIDALAKMVDPALNGMYPVKSLSRFADIIALCVQPEPEFRPPMSEVVQQLVRLMQRASVIRRRSGDEIGLSYRVAELDNGVADLSF